MAAARAVFLNDLNEEFEPWLEPLLKQARFKGAKIVVSRGVRTLTAEEEHPISGRQLPAAIDPHGWLDPRNLLRTVEIAASKAGIENVGAHTLRHSAAVGWLESGVHIKAAADLLGHASISITGDLYGHTSDDAARAAVNGLGDALGL